MDTPETKRGNRLIGLGTAVLALWHVRDQIEIWQPLVLAVVPLNLLEKYCIDASLDHHHQQTMVSISIIVSLQGLIPRSSTGMACSRNEDGGGWDSSRPSIFLLKPAESGLAAHRLHFSQPESIRYLDQVRGRGQAVDSNVKFLVTMWEGSCSGMRLDGQSCQEPSCSWTRLWDKRIKKQQHGLMTHAAQTLVWRHKVPFLQIFQGSTKASTFRPFSLLQFHHRKDSWLQISGDHVSTSFVVPTTQTHFTECSHSVEDNQKCAFPTRIGFHSTIAIFSTIQLQHIRNLLYSDTSRCTLMICKVSDVRPQAILNYCLRIS